MTDVDDEFQIVENCGGRITFLIKDEGDRRMYSTSFNGSFKWTAAFFGVYALVPQGLPVATFVMSGIGSPWEPPTPNGCIPVFMLSDREGFSGRKCPSCERYFREKGASVRGPAYCPYCAFVGQPHQFLTDGHRHYVQMYVDRFVEAYENGYDVTIDMNALANESKANERQLYAYTEEKQQTRFKCDQCKCVVDILGQYGSCPSCGKRNTLQVFLASLSHLEERVKNPRHSADQRQQREAEWRELVKQCVSHFEGFARDLTALLQQLPATPTRKKAISAISFHNPIEAAANLKAFFDIDLLVGVGEKEQKFLRMRFLRRHVYEHNSAVADQEYVSRSEDTVRVGQLLKERSSHVQTLIDLLRTVASNYDQGITSMR